MYYNSSTSQAVSPIRIFSGPNNLKENLFYIIGEIFGKIFKENNEINSINSDFTGYTEDNYKEAEKVYSMAYVEINQLANNFLTANDAIRDISLLQSNWNGNGAQPFSEMLVNKCYIILNQLAAEPFVCPTACGAIQFEYEKENGEYLEFEIYEDKIEVYSVSAEGEESENILLGMNAIDQVKQMVVDFYG